MSRVSSKSHFVYVLWSTAGRRFYIGISEDSQKRLRQHNEGGSKWTARYRPWELVHVEAYSTYMEARKREILLKKQKGGHGFFRLTGLDPSKFPRMETPSGS